MAVYYNIGTNLAKFCFTLFASCRIEGKEAVPPKGPLIVVSNHLSNADIPLMVVSIPRKLFFLAKKGLFYGPIVSSILKGVGAQPIEGEGSDLRATRWALRMLEQDKALLIFPEAARSLTTASMNKAGPGIAYLAHKSQAPILPVAITGTEKIPSMLRIPFPLCRMTMRIGDPFTLPVIEGKPSRDLLEHMTDMIMHRVANLLPEGYQGHYRTPAPTPP